MRGIHYNNVYFGVHKSFHAFQTVCCNSDSGAAEQTSLGILCGKRVFYLLLNVLDRNKTFEIAFIVHDRQLFFSGLGKNLLGFLRE